jgi:hypothetical protein
MRGIVYCAVSNPIYATYLRASNAKLPRGEVVIWHDATYEKYAMQLCPELFI